MQYLHTRIVNKNVKLAGRLGLIGLSVALQASLAWAGDINSKVPLKIPTQDLASALTALATQADLQILFSQDLVAGKLGSELSGEFSGSEALQRLLTNADLDFTVNGRDTIVIRSRNVPMFRRTAQQLEQTAQVPEPSSGEESDNGAVLEEILVTAQKRTERLQDVPVAVTAISGDVLEESGINDTSSLTKLAPSLTFTQGNHPSNSSFRVRGVGTAVFGLGVEPSVSVVVDGVALARAAQGFADLADIERVEVLRGPQGTLFGKNAVAGLLNVTTRRPSQDFEGTADATWADGDEYRIRGSISGPFSDTLRARVTGYYNDIGGHIRNVTVNKDINGQKSTGVRTKLEWDATADLNFLLSNDYRYIDSLCCGSTFVRAENPALQAQIGVPVGGVWSDNNYRYDFENELTWFRSKQWIHSLEANWTLPVATLTSVTAYQKFDFNNNQPVDRLNTAQPINLTPNSNIDINGGPINLSQFTQELRLTSPGGQRLNYVTGLYYLSLDLDRGFQRRMAACTVPTAQGAGQPCVATTYRSQTDFKANEKIEHMAVFGQADLSLIGNLSALAGVRWQREDLSYNGNRTNTRMVAGDLPLPGFSPSTSGSGSSTDAVVTGKAGLKYEFSRDAQTYLTWARGYKGAAYETEFSASFEGQTPILPETATSYELGFKGLLFDDHLNVNVAVFRSQFRNLQVQANRGDQNLGIVRFATTNAGSATTQGAELEFSLRTFTGFTLSGGVTYLDTSVDVNGLQCPVQFQNAAPVMSGTPTNVCYRPAAGATPLQNVSGGVLPMASKWRGNLTARYERELGASLVGFGQLSANSQSEFQFVIEQDPMLMHPGYTLVDGAIGLHDADDRYQVTLFVKNLLDKHYFSGMAHAAAFTSATVTPGNLVGLIPKDANRYYGVTVGVSF